MPKAYDVKHNYYADLELPTTASVEEVKKQYRKLALLYHPDRNAGKEEEFIPKFQAIQAAHEILGDALQKNKYDADRRKAGLYPGGGVGGGAPRGSPYTANSAYPPPPRRTQPGTWQRPAATGGAPPTGAERFTNFPRQTPTAKRADPAAERQNAFTAWQNMNSAQGRQNQAQNQHSRHPSSGPAPPTPRRPQPPPRQDTKFPSDEKIRAGFNYREAPSSSHTAEKADERQSAWAAFQQSHANKPGVSRSNTTRTPKKQGFDPNVPGSDERPAPDSAYNRHKSEDFGRPGPVPPPPPGPPPSQPTTPLSPTAKRPFADPLRPFKGQNSGDEDTPYSEGNRVRSPYSGSFMGERTDTGMRRSNSTRDNTKLSPESATWRARSTSPLGRQAKPPNSRRNAPAFEAGATSSSSADNSEPEVTSTPEQYHSPFAHPNKPKVAPHDRPKKVPSPPSKRFNGATNPTSPPTDGASSDAAETQQKNIPREWMSRMFGYGPGVGSQATIPNWAFPASVLPVRKSSTKAAAQQASVLNFGRSLKDTDLLPRAVDLSAPTTDEQRAYNHLRVQLGQIYGSAPHALDMEVFLKLASASRLGEASGHALLDRVVQQTLHFFPSVGYPQVQHANIASHPDRFSFPITPDTFSPTGNPKARSEESINTKFSADGWNGTFAGSGDYFAPPSANTRKNSQTKNGQRPGMRSATSNYPQSQTNGNTFDGASMPPPPRPAAAPEPVTSPLSAASDGRFNKEQWEASLNDGSWSWPPPPPKPPGSPAKAAAKAKAPSRKGSRSSAKSPAVGASAANPHVVDEEDDQTVDPNNIAGRHTHEPEPMDIDQDPPAVQSPAPPPKEPRMVSVPPSAWRQQHNGTSHHTSNLSTNLSDLARVAPFTPAPTGLKDLSALSSTLPFPSTPSTTLPTHPLHPSNLRTPLVPKPPDAPTRLTKKNWHLFAQNFALYLRAFHNFNTTFLQHFEAREAQAQARMREGGAWLEATGDSIGGGGMLTGPSGWGEYLKGVKEDEHVREVWGVGVERHREAVRGFEGVRERVRRLVVGGGWFEGGSWFEGGFWWGEAFFGGVGVGWARSIPGIALGDFWRV